MSVDLDSVEASADRFIRLHPQHPNIDYAYYMRGLAAFTGNRSVLDRFFGGEESRRDMSGAQVAFAYFSEFLNRFPDSEYAKDAHQRMIYLRNLLAQAEVDIASRDRSWINIMTFGLVDRPNVPPPLQISQPGAGGSTALPSDKRESVTETAPRKPWYRRIFG